MTKKKNKINTEYLKEHNLYDAHRRFMKLSEAYIQLPEELDEAGEEEQQGQDPNAQAGGDETIPGLPPVEGEGVPQDQGQDPNAQGADPNGSMGEDPNAQGMPQGGDSNGADMGMGDPSMQGSDPMGGGMPPMDDMGMGAEEGSDDEVIDVDDITKAQEKLNIKQNHVGLDLGKVDTKISQLFTAINQMQDSISKTNGEIESLRDEFQKRNPTQVEKLNLRSLDSYPFNISPNDYWKHQTENGRYNPYADNSESTTKEYEITNDDVANPGKNIADTFSIPDEDIQDINKIFGF